MAEVNHFYAEENTLQTETTAAGISTAADVVEILGSSLAANTKYLIICRALIGIDSTTNKVGAGVRILDDNAVEQKSIASYEMERTGTGDLKSYFFVHSYTTDASPSNVGFRVWRDDASGTARADQASLLLIDLDDLGTEGTDYHESIEPVDTGDEYSTSPDTTQLALISDVKLGTTEEWLILGYARCDVGSTGRWFDITLDGADDAASASTLFQVREEGEDTTEQRICGVVGRHKAVTSNVGCRIYGQEEANNGNMTDGGAYLIAIKGSLFDDFEHDFTPGVISVGAETTIASVGPYTPTTNGNHLIIGAGGNDSTGATSLDTMHLEDGTTETRTGDSAPTHTQVWDNAKDLEPYYTMERISISAQKTYNLRAAKFITGDVARRWLLVLNLNLAGGALSITPALTSQTLTTFAPADIDRDIPVGLTTQSLTTFAPTDIARDIPAGLVTQALTTFAFSDLSRTIPAGLVSQILATFAPNVGEQFITPALVSQLITDFAPTFTIDITPALTTQTATTFDPIVGPPGLTPALTTQSLTAFDPLGVGIQFVQPGLTTQSLTAFDPNVGEQFVTPGLTTQTATPFAFSDLARDIAIALVTQTLTTFAPTDIDRDIPVGLTTQSITAFNPEVAVVGGPQTVGPPALVSQLATPFAPIVGPPGLVVALTTQSLTALASIVGPPGLTPAQVSQIVTALGPSVSFTITPALVSQLLTDFAPAGIDRFITVGLTTQTLTPFAPTVGIGADQNLDIALVVQTLTPLAPAIANRQLIDIALVTQTLTVFEIPGYWGGLITPGQGLETAKLYRLFTGSVGDRLTLVWGARRSIHLGHATTETWEPVSDLFSFRFADRDDVMPAVNAAWLANKDASATVLEDALNSALTTAGYTRPDGSPLSRMDPVT